MLRKRKYDSYEQYVEHQKDKFETIIEYLKERHKSRYQTFIKRFQPLKKLIGGDKVLCLGARTGEEVQAFRHLGFQEAIGIDLNPGKNNPYVVEGDFHALDYDDNSLDALYCNSLDHAWDLKLIASEAQRVLKSGGIFIAHITFLHWDTKKIKKHLKKSKHESMLWDCAEDIIAQFEQFIISKRFRDNINKNWHFIIFEVK